MLLQVMDATDGLGPGERPETHIWTKKLQGETVCLRAYDVPQRAYLEWPEGVPYDEMRANAIACDMNNAIVRQTRWSKTCPRTACPCGKSRPQQNVMCTDPCIEVQKRVQSAVVIQSTRMVMRLPMSRCVKDPIPFIEFELTRSYFANPACSFLYREVESLARTEKRWLDVEVYEIIGDGVLAYLYATCDLTPTPTPEDVATGVGGFSWVDADVSDAQLVHKSEQLSTCSKEYVVHFTQVRASTENATVNAPRTILSLDMEMASINGAFPLPTHSAILCICVYAAGNDGTGQPFKVAFTWGGPVAKSETGIHVVVTDTEANMLVAFAKGYSHLDADISTGYNDSAFDWPFYFARAAVLGVSEECSRISRRVDYHSHQLCVDRSSAQSGARKVYFYDVPGRTFMDAMIVVMRKRMLASYSLDNVSEKILGDHKLEMPYEDLVPNHNGGPIKKLKNIEYCMKDAELPVRLLVTLQAVSTMGGEARTCGVLLRHLLTNGVQMRIARFMRGFTLPKGVLCAKHKTVLAPKAEPVYDVYGDLVVEEFDPDDVPDKVQVIPAYRDVLPPIPVIDSDNEEEMRPVAPPKRQGRQTRLPFAKAVAAPTAAAAAATTTTAALPKRKKKKKKKSRGKAGYQGARVLKPKKGFYGPKNPIATLDFASLYPSIQMAKNLCPSTFVKSLAYALAQGVAAEDVYRTEAGYLFVKKRVREGVMPCALRIILAERARIRKQMKNHAKGTPEHVALDAWQGAIKIVANSVYGATGAKQGPFFAIMVSSSVTGTGRVALTKVRDYVNNGGKPKSFGRFKDVVLDVIYGDTDSVMVKCTHKDVENNAEAALELLDLVADSINKESGIFEAPMNMSAECVYMPYILLDRKKYLAQKIVRGEKPVLLEKGTVGVRRDNASYVSETASTVSRMLLMQNLKHEVLAYVRGRVQRLYNSDVPMKELVITQRLSQAPDDYVEQTHAHLTVVREWTAHNPVTAPVVGARVPYLFCISPKEAKGYERARPPYAVESGSARIDYQYYITKRLRNPIEDVLSVVFGQEACDALFSEAARSNYDKTTKSSTGEVLYSTRVRRSAAEASGAAPPPPPKRGRQMRIDEMLPKAPKAGGGEKKECNLM